MGLLTDLLGDGDSGAYPSGFDLIANTDLNAVSVGDVSMNANRGYFYRLTYGQSMTASKIALEIGVSSGNLCVAVYANTGTGKNARPGTRKATSGTVASPGTGRREIALDTTVEVNLGDWIYVGADNATIRVKGAAPVNNTLMEGLSGHQDAGFPAPTTAALTQNNPASRLVPLVAVP